MNDKYLHGIEFTEIAGNVEITTGATSVIGIVGDLELDADTTDMPYNAPFLIKSKQDMLGWASGSLYEYINEIFKQTSPIIVAVRVEKAIVTTEGTSSEEKAGITYDDNATANNCAGEDVAKTGIFALENASSVVKYTPKLLCIPYYSQLSTGSIAITNMILVAQRLRAIAFTDAPNTTDADAITFAESQNSPRLYITDPFYMSVDSKGVENLYAPSALVTAMFAKTDANYGFWYSPSNKAVSGITNLNRPITFNISNPDTSANYLNEKGIATFIYSESNKTFKLWGNRSPATNPNDAFTTVRRVIDVIEDAIEVSQAEELDKPITGETTNQIQNKVQTYLNTLISQGALLGGRCWIDKSENTITELKAGHLVISFDCEPPSPLERLTFKVYRNDGYYEEVFS